MANMGAYKIFENTLEELTLLFFLSRVKNVCYNRRNKICLSILFYFFRKEDGQMLENRFKTNLIKEIEYMFPGCMVLHLDANEIQGIPDLLILYENKWAVLEGKRSMNAAHQPNQDYYIDVMNQMSFASFIYPENKKEVLDELQRALQPKRTARISKR